MFVCFFYIYILFAMFKTLFYIILNILCNFALIFFLRIFYYYLFIFLLPFTQALANIKVVTSGEIYKILQSQIWVVSRISEWCNKDQQNWPVICFTVVARVWTHIFSSCWKRDLITDEFQITQLLFLKIL